MSEAASQPNHALYVESWGRSGDVGVIAEVGGVPAGAVWWRRFTDERHGYGFIEEEVPEVSIAVVRESRGHGVGTALLEALIERARGERLRALSLSVEVDNPALRLYRRVGFTAVEAVGNALTMRLDLAHDTNVCSPS